MAQQYLFANGPMATTSAFAAVTTGTSLKTMLQVKGVTAVTYKVIEWGISFDGSAAATPGKVELVETGTIFGTVTAAVAADIYCFDANGSNGVADRHDGDFRGHDHAHGGQ